MTNRYLVTGGTGFLGRALVRSLVEKGHFVRVLDDDSRGSFGSLRDVQEKIEFVRGDIRDPSAVDRACEGIESVCHLAFVNGTEFFYSKPELVLEVGVKGMVNILDACIKNQVPELMLMSSSEVYQLPPTIPTAENAPLTIPDPQNPRYSYAGGKLISELMAINYGRKHFKRVLVIRPHNVYGPEMGWEHVVPQFIVRVKKAIQDSQGHRPVPFQIQGSGQESRSFVYIDDFTRGVIEILEKGEHLGIYHVGTMEERTIRDVALEVARCFNVEIQLQSGPLLQGSVMRRCPDTGKVEGLGYRPKISFSEGIRRTVQWYDQNIKG